MNISLFILCLLGSAFMYMVYKIIRYAFLTNLIFVGGVLLNILLLSGSWNSALLSVLLVICPLLLCNILLYVFLQKKELDNDSRYQVKFKLEPGELKIKNIRRGASIIGAAGSGKTESIVYGFLKHFQQYSYCGIIHDYKNFELTEIAYPLFKEQENSFYIISFDKIFNRVNPIAPRYLENEESVNEVSRVLLDNLLEQKDSTTVGSNKFFYDAAEGLVGGLIWKLRTDYPQFCTIPHLIAIYQNLPNDGLLAFLNSNTISRAMASAFLTGIGSERQTAGVKSTLANALKKICTKNIFMALSADEVPLDINSSQNPAVISVVNNPKYETAYSPVIATIIHTITKQMSVRNAKTSFILMEEAPTIRLLNMHRIPATLRSYDIATVYVMQDKVQNDIIYGDKASKAILSNLSYQFFGKVNDPDTAKYYERFFEIVKKETTSINRGHNLNFDTRVTTGEKEVSKIRADEFFRLKEGEFITYADGKDRKVQFKLPKIIRELPQENQYTLEQLDVNFARIYLEANSIFKREED
ncbi:type IV secretory system conjugative DNA transfer family protein [Zunongwangia sp. H14]|uniref:type IV secretory system conjugative DNA transfer family protein n=1 Tax=Zunongwangia sp. H14 TaxID=3240792 RepID=UPI0035657942